MRKDGRLLGTYDVQTSAKSYCGRICALPRVTVLTPLLVVRCGSREDLRRPQHLRVSGQSHALNSIISVRGPAGPSSTRGRPAFRTYCVLRRRGRDTAEALPRALVAHAHYFAERLVSVEGRKQSQVPACALLP